MGWGGVGVMIGGSVRFLSVQCFEGVNVAIIFRHWLPPLLHLWRWWWEGVGGTGGYYSERVTMQLALLC